MVVQNKSHQEIAESEVGRTFEMLTGPGYKEHEIDRGTLKTAGFTIQHMTLLDSYTTFLKVESFYSEWRCIFSHIALLCLSFSTLMMGLAPPLHSSVLYYLTQCNSRIACLHLIF